MSAAEYEFGEDEPQRHVVTMALTEHGRDQLISCGLKLRKESIRWKGTRFGTYNSNLVYLLSLYFVLKGTH